MKKHELLKHAYDNYPKGTKFKNLTTGKENISIGSFEVGTFGITTSEEIEGGKTLLCRYKDLKWAEIVNPKIAVKVENEKEFKALMKYYYSLGWKWNDKCSPLDPSGKYQSTDTNIIQFNDKFVHIGTLKFPIADYQIIPFSDFAKEHSIKLTLIISEDGVDLYEGDRYFMFDYDEGVNGNFDGFRGEGFKATYFPLKGYDKQPAIFSTKESALKWIEEQKPKRNYLSGGEVYFEIEENSIKFLSKLKETTHAIHFLTKHDLELINNAIKELS
jgi:hypothetical protein